MSTCVSNPITGEAEASRSPELDGHQSNPTDEPQVLMRDPVPK